MYPPILAVATQSTLYRIVLLLHILAAIVGFGGVLLNGVYAAQSKQRPGPGGRAISEANYAVAAVAEKAIYAVAVFGLALVALSDGAWDFGQTWVWLSTLLYVVSLALSHSILIPNHRRINGLLAEMEQGPPPAGGPPPQVATIEALGKQQGMTSMVLDVMLVVVLVLMIWRPGA